MLCSAQLESTTSKLSLAKGRHRASPSHNSTRSLTPSRAALCQVASRLLPAWSRSEEHRLNSSHGYISYAVFCLKKKKHTSELQSRLHLVCRLLLEKKKADDWTPVTHTTHRPPTALKAHYIVECTLVHTR